MSAGVSRTPVGIRGAYRRELEGLRAVAFLLVFFFHAGRIIDFGAPGNDLGPIAALVGGG